MLEHIKRLSKHSLRYGTGEVLSKAIGILLIPVYTRYLTTHQYGIIEIARVIESMMGILCTLGVSSALGRYYFDYTGIELKKYIGTITIAIILIPLIIIGLFSIFGNKVFSIFVKQIPFDPYVKLILWVSFFSVGPATLLGLFMVEEKSLNYVIFRIFQSLLIISSIIYFVAVLKKGALGQIQGKLWAVIILSIIAFWCLKKKE